jgi:ABC-type methionine transport system ATPase subunit
MVEMVMAVRRVHLTFPTTQVTEPVVWAIGRNFDVITNIRRANISDGTGWMALDLEGPESAIEGALAYIRERGIAVDAVDALDGPKGAP